MEQQIKETPVKGEQNGVNPVYTDLLDKYRDRVKHCSSTEEVLLTYIKMDSWCKKKLSKNTDNNVITKLRDISTAEAVKRIAKLNDGMSLKELSFKLHIFWDGNRIKTALTTSDAITKVQSDYSVKETDKIELFRKNFEILKNILADSTPTERLYICLRLKNGVELLQAGWVSLTSTHPQQGEEKEKSSAKREREKSDEEIQPEEPLNKKVKDGGVEFVSLDKDSLIASLPETDSDVTPLFPNGMGDYKPWNTMKSWEKKHVIDEWILDGFHFKYRIKNASTKEERDKLVNRLYERLEIWTTGECKSTGEKLDNMKCLLPFDYEDKEMLQKNIRIMRSDEFEDVIKTDADMPDYMFYYLPELGNTILPSSHRGFKYRPVIMNVYNEKDVDVDEYNDMFKLDKEKKNLETQEKVFESIKNDFKKN